MLPHVRLLAGEAAAGAVEAAAAGRLDQLYLLLQCAGQPMIYLMIFAMDPSSSEEAAQVVPPRAAAMAARASQFQPQCVLAWVAAVVDAASALIVARGELGGLCGLGWAGLWTRLGAAGARLAAAVAWLASTAAPYAAASSRKLCSSHMCALWPACRCLQAAAVLC